MCAQAKTENASLSTIVLSNIFTLVFLKMLLPFTYRKKLFKVSFYYFLRFEAKKKKRLLGEWLYRFFVKSFLNKILNVFIWHVKEDSLNVLF